MKVIAIFFALVLLNVAVFANNSNLNITEKEADKIKFSFKTDDKESLYSLFLREKIKPKKEQDLSKFDKKNLNTIDLKSSLISSDGVYFLTKIDFAQKGEIALINIKANTDYVIDIYKQNTKNPKNPSVYSSMEFHTMAAEPTIQADAIVFTHVTENQIGLAWKNGNGAKRIVVAKKGSMPDEPKDGTRYEASTNFGDAKSQIGKTNSYVVFDGFKPQSGKFVDVKFKDAGTYYFRVFEYNGDAEAINYNTKKTASNPRQKSTRITAPKVNPVTKMIPGGFILSWSKVPTATSYEIAIAYDKDFTKYADTYESTDFGDLNEIEISIEDFVTRPVYCKVRCIGPDSKSDYSNVILVENK